MAQVPPQHYSPKSPPPLPFPPPFTRPRRSNFRKLLWRLLAKLPAKLGARQFPRHSPQRSKFCWQFLLGSKKTNKRKTHKHFSDGPHGTIVPGTNPHPSQGQTGQNRDFTVELNRERSVCPRDGSHFVPGRGPICPRDGSCLSRRPSRRKCLCLLVFFWPDLQQSPQQFS